MSTTFPKPRTVDVHGRAVGIYDYGDPAGAPVFVFHGTPACGAGFGWADEPARALGLRLLAPDRPGVGLSARLDHYRVGEYSDQVGALADALGIERFAVWGYSGGGPYAVACAARLGSRVQHAAVAAGAGQIGEWATRDEFEKTDRQMLGLCTTRPWLARAILGVSGRLARLAPGVVYKSFAKQVSPSDRVAAELLGSPRDVMALFTEAFLHGSAGVVADYAAIAQPWGVDVSAIKGPMTIWHGDADPMVPLAHSTALASRVPHAKLTVWPGEGHLAVVTHVREILTAVANDL
jgi:pimeloyl-ACP methyl ester carboxylesterase